MGGDAGCLQGCEKPPRSEQEVAESTLQLIELRKQKVEGTQRQGIKKSVTAPRTVSSGAAPSKALGRGACFLIIMFVSAFLDDQVREKKDVPLGPEDPKEEDGSFDYRCVTCLLPCELSSLPQAPHLKAAWPSHKASASISLPTGMSPLPLPQRGACAQSSHVS